MATKKQPAKAKPKAEPAPTSPPSIPASSPAPSSPPTLLFPNEPAWEAYLETHPDNTAGVWLQIAKKNAPAPSVTYAQALDAALCHGWIDGQRRALDATHFLQKFTPRRKNSLWSARNVAKVAALAAAGRMRARGLAEVDAARGDGRWERAYAGSGAIEVPVDFGAALEGNAGAKRFFAALNRSQRYSFLWRIETTKKPETRRRKVAQLVEMLAEERTF